MFNSRRHHAQPSNWRWRRQAATTGSTDEIAGQARQEEVLGGWRGRLAMLLCMLAVALLHSLACGGLPNSPVGMLVFHGSAALLDLGLLYLTPRLLHGHVSRDTQALLLLSIIFNAVGWVLYMAYVPPLFFNGAMWLLSCAQAFRLLLVRDDGFDSLGHYLVRGRHRIGHHLHSGKGNA